MDGEKLHAAAPSSGAMTAGIGSGLPSEAELCLPAKRPLTGSRPECDDRWVGHNLAERQKELRASPLSVERAAVTGHVEAPLW